MGSVKRVAQKVNKGSKLGAQAFTAIGYKLLEVTDTKAVATLFDILRGKRPLSDALAQVHAQQQSTEGLHGWTQLKGMGRQLEMLTACHAMMDREQFNSLPNSTNAVESHNRLSKGITPDILHVAQ